MTAHHDAKPQMLDDGEWGARIFSHDAVHVGDSVTTTTKKGVSRTAYVAEILKEDRKLKIVRTSEEPPDTQADGFSLGWPDPGDPPVDDEPPPWPDEEPPQRVPFPPREETYPTEHPAPSPPGLPSASATRVAGDVDRLVRDFRDAINRFLGENDA